MCFSGKQNVQLLHIAVDQASGLVNLSKQGHLLTYEIHGVFDLHQQPGRPHVDQHSRNIVQEARQ